jgi:uncharacterized protein YbjT (DUF2867 family)
VSHVFITGATGYMGRRLTAELLARGHQVRALVRPGSEHKAPPGAEVCTGDALDSHSFRHLIAPARTLVHLVGVPHPSPLKAGRFRRVDLSSVVAATEAARHAGIRHFIYVSVAQPAPVMQAYVAARGEGEAVIREAGLRATILRPWYVLGPGHRWPAALLPAYWLMERIPRTRQAALRLGLVTIRQMTGALAAAVERPPSGVRIVEVPEIRGNLQRARTRTMTGSIASTFTGMPWTSSDPSNGPAAPPPTATL